MPLSRRYTPELAPGEISVFGMDYSAVIPKGVGIASGALTISPNTAGGTGVSAGAVSVHDRTLYATVTAQQSADGFDWKLLWTATDTDGNVWPRTGLVLCAATS